MGFFLLLAYCLCYQMAATVSAVSGDGMCTTTRLVKVVDKFSSEDWPCEDYFPSFSCDQIRSGETQIEDVFIPLEVKVCCPGSFLEEGRCQSPCPEGLYGPDCMLLCTCVHASGPCNPVDGTCDCKEGWTGRDCDQRCPPGEFGRNCWNTTSPCLNGGTNDPVTGVCLCPTDHQGDYCEQACTAGSCRIDCRKCLQRSGARPICDPNIAACRCKDHWMGHFCTEPCPVGFKGPHCEDPCCSGNGMYNPKTKSCKCKDGYYGDDCEDMCLPGTYGPGCGLSCDCDKCDHVTGACTECPIGLTGFSCSSSCSNHTWGHSCNETCKCSAEMACDSFTGSCQKTPLHNPKSLSKVSGRGQPEVPIAGGIAAVGGLILFLVITVILFIAVKILRRKRHPITEAEAFPALNVKPEGPNERSTDDYTKEDTVYQEIEEYPLRYVKPALPSAPPGKPLDLFKYQKVDKDYDPHYLVPDVK